MILVGEKREEMRVNHYYSSNVVDYLGSYCNRHVYSDPLIVTLINIMKADLRSKQMWEDY